MFKKRRKESSKNVIKDDEIEGTNQIKSRLFTNLEETNQFKK
jgi:hypothetical protein